MIATTTPQEFINALNGIIHEGNKGKINIRSEELLGLKALERFTEDFCKQLEKDFRRGKEDNFTLAASEREVEELNTQIYHLSQALARLEEHCRLITAYSRH